MVEVYNPGIPQPRDIPSRSQSQLFLDFKLLNDYFNVNHVPFAGIITNIEKTNPCRISSPIHTLLTGDQVTFSNLNAVTGMQELNGNTYTITVVDQNRFTLNGVDASSYSTYVNGGNYSSAQLQYGFHKLINFAKDLENDPNEINAKNIYTKKFENKSSLYYQYGATAGFVDPLTSYFPINKIERIGTDNANVGSHTGYKTPWGLILNIGTVRSIDFPLVNYTFAIPYTTKVYTLIGSVFLTAVQKNQKLVTNIVSLTQFQAAAFVSSGKLDPFQAVNYIALGK